MYKTQGNSVHLKTQRYINLKTLLFWRLGRDKWGTYNALLSRNSFPNFLLPWGIWRFNHIFWLRPCPVGDVMHTAYCMWLSISHPFLALETPPLPIPCQDYLWAHLPYFSGTQIKGRGSTLSPNYVSVLSPYSLSPLPLQFRIHHVLFIYWLTPLFIQQCSLSTYYGSALLLLC